MPQFFSSTGRDAQPVRAGSPRWVRSPAVRPPVVILAGAAEDADMTESDERLDTLSEKIDQAEGAAKSLSVQDVIDPDPVEGELPDSVEEATGRAETGREEMGRGKPS